jgi:acyl-CoA synthetase (AMP-forming)/AMP-acid ligase II/acyl carrier protein
LTLCDSSTLFHALARGESSQARIATWSEAPGEGATLAELLLEAEAVGSSLARRAEAGDRVLIGLPPGRAFLASFIGALFAGLIPAAIAPPSGRRRAERLGPMIAVASPRLLVCESSPLEATEIATVTAAELTATDGRLRRAARPEDVAYLQFTSGSTALPRAVVISHGALAANIACIAAKADLAPRSTLLTWLPVHHDMGLVSALFALSQEFDLVVERPETFSRSPVSWLEAISRHRADCSGAPNFAFELLNRAVLGEGTEPLDLSSWRVAFCGAEPIRPAALERFARRFAPHGFDARSLCPAYGMAEFTVQAVAAGADLEARSRGVESAHGSREVMSVGTVVEGHDLAIVDPEARRRLAEGEIGEIWLDGPSKGAGYWREPEATRAIFEAQIVGEPGKGWLRTGDLGVTLDGELYVLGRIKDVIIIRGRNFHAQEVEAVATAAHPLVAQGGVAAFSYVDGEQGEALGLACELVRRPDERVDLARVIDSIQRELAGVLGVGAGAIALVRPHSLPRTTSGKLRRADCARGLAEGALASITTWRQGEASTPLPAAGGGTRDADEIARWIEAWFGARLGVAARFGASTPLADLGLDSLDALKLAHDLEDWLRRPVSGAAIFEVTTIGGLAEALASARPEEREAIEEAEPEPLSASLTPRLAEIGDDDAAQDFERRLAELEQMSDSEVESRLARVRD